VGESLDSGKVLETERLNVSFQSPRLPMTFSRAVRRLLGGRGAGDTLQRRTGRGRLGLALFVCGCAFLIAYPAWFILSRPIALRIEGTEPISIAEFGTGAAVRHAFQMPVDGLSEIRVRISADQPSTLTLHYRLLQLSDSSDGAEDRLNAYSEIYRWTDRATMRAGEQWHRAKFAAVSASKDRWYAFEIVLRDASPTPTPAAGAARPAVSIAASRDNPPQGGKLWVDGVRQPGSLFIRVYRRSEEARSYGLLVYPWTLAALVYVIFFARGGELAASPAPPRSTERAGSRRSPVLHRAWIPAVVFITIAAFVPRAMEATRRMSGISRAAGVDEWTTGDANEFGQARFRWMKRQAALWEPVRGRMLQVPLFIDRPGIETPPVTLRVTLAGVDTPPIVVQGRGWQTATYNLDEVFGESDWKSLTAITLSFGFTGLPDDGSLPRVGLGDVHWSGASPR
jgi:hypothetical protein